MDAAARKDSAPNLTYGQEKVGLANPITTASDPKDAGELFVDKMQIWLCIQPGNINWPKKLEKERQREGAVGHRTKSSWNGSTEGQVEGKHRGVSNRGMKQSRRRYLNIKEENIRIAALNENGIRKPHKILALGRYLASLEPQPDICILTGTQLYER